MIEQTEKITEEDRYAPHELHLEKKSREYLQPSACVAKEVAYGDSSEERTLISKSLQHETVTCIVGSYLLVAVLGSILHALQVFLVMHAPATLDYFLYLVFSSAVGCYKLVFMGSIPTVIGIDLIEKTKISTEARSILLLLDIVCLPSFIYLLFVMIQLPSSFTFEIFRLSWIGNAQWIYASVCAAVAIKFWSRWGKSSAIKFQTVI